MKVRVAMVVKKTSSVMGEMKSASPSDAARQVTPNPILFPTFANSMDVAKHSVLVTATDATESSTLVRVKSC